MNLFSTELLNILTCEQISRSRKKSYLGRFRRRGVFEQALGLYPIFNFKSAIRPANKRQIFISQLDQRALLEIGKKSEKRVDTSLAGASPSERSEKNMAALGSSSSSKLHVSNSSFRSGIQGADRC